MRYVLIFICFILACVLSPSCKKYSHNYFRGNVIADNTGKPIEGACAVLQYWNYKKGDTAPYQYDTVYTNSDGYFVFFTRKKIGWAYRLMVNKAKYSNYYLDNTNKKPPYRVNMFAYAPFQLRVKKKTNATKLIDVNYAGQNFKTRFDANKNANSFDTILKTVTLRTDIPVSVSYNVNNYSNPFLTLPESVVSYSKTLNFNLLDTLKYTIEYD